MLKNRLAVEPAKRDEILAHVRAGTLSRTKAAAMLGLTRQYVGVLAKKGAAPMNPPPAPAPNPNPPALPLVTGAKDAPPAASPEGQSKLAALLARAQAPPPGPPPPAAGAPPPPLQPIQDPEEIAAGQELMEMFAGGIGPEMATRIYEVKRDDPRLDPLRTPTKFTSLVLKRQTGAAAFLGKMTGGFIGWLISAGVETFRAVSLGRGLRLPIAQAPPPAAADAREPEGLDEEFEEEEETGEGLPTVEDPTAAAEQQAGKFSIKAAKQRARGEVA